MRHADCNVEAPSAPYPAPHVAEEVGGGGSLGIAAGRVLLAGAHKVEGKEKRKKGEKMAEGTSAGLECGLATVLRHEEEAGA